MFSSALATIIVLSLNLFLDKAMETLMQGSESIKQRKDDMLRLLYS